MIYWTFFWLDFFFWHIRFTAFCQYMNKSSSKDTCLIYIAHTCFIYYSKWFELQLLIFLMCTWVAPSWCYELNYLIKYTWYSTLQMLFFPKRVFFFFFCWPFTVVCLVLLIIIYHFSVGSLHSTLTLDVLQIWAGQPKSDNPSIGSSWMWDAGDTWSNYCPFSFAQ